MDQRQSLARLATAPRGRIRLRTAVTIVAGFVAGAIGAAVFPALIERRHANPAASEPNAQLANVADPVERGRQAMTEARLRVLEAAAKRESSAATGPSAVASAGTDEPVAAADTRAYHEGRLAAHANEPVDTHWAAATSDRLGKSLGAAAGTHHFQTVELDCRSATCAATLEWPSYTEAVQTADDLLHDPTVPCGRQVVMPQPDDQAARYRTTVLYHDCS